jgi:GNAT superfamily N-acetyltransferase
MTLARTESHYSATNGSPDLSFGECVASLGQISMYVRIRLMHVEDIPAGLHLCRLSRWNQLEEDWRAFLGSPDGGGWLAECAGAAIGTVTFLRYGRGFSWLSMMLVHPDARRAGIGTRLMEAALEALAGEACVRLDATPLGERLYRRLGFSSEYELVRARVTAPHGRFGPVPENVRPMENGDWAEVLALDCQVFGADRSALLTSFYRRAPDLACTVHSGKTLRGYCFGRSGYLYRQLGPIVADDVAVARDLVAHCLARQPGENLAVDVPRFPPDWIVWLESMGFTVERLFLRMGRGPTKCPGIAGRQFAIAGPEFG